MWTRETPTKDGWYWVEFDHGYLAVAQWKQAWFYGGYSTFDIVKHYSIPIAEPEEAK